MLTTSIHRVVLIGSVALLASGGVCVLGAEADGGDPDAGPPSDAGAVELPRDCAAIRAREPGAPDGDYTLYHQGRADRPWTARCVDMNAAPRAYLTLTVTGPAHNYSSHAPTPGVPGQTAVVTSYQRVRIDPHALVVDTGDLTFASSTGRVVSLDHEVVAMPFAAAMSCDPEALAGANVDLAGTPFALAEQFCIGGLAARGGWKLAADRRSAELYGGGDCGWTSVTRADDACVQHPSTTAGGGQVLDLVYKPVGTGLAQRR